MQTDEGETVSYNCQRRLHALGSLRYRDFQWKGHPMTWTPDRPTKPGRYEVCFGLPRGFDGYRVWVVEVWREQPSGKLYARRGILDIPIKPEPGDIDTLTEALWRPYVEPADVGVPVRWLATEATKEGWKTMSGDGEYEIRVSDPKCCKMVAHIILDSLPALADVASEQDLAVGLCMAMVAHARRSGMHPDDMRKMFDIVASAPSDEVTR